MLRKWRQVRGSKLVGNAFALYIAYVANWLVPLITVPYTVRVLAPAGYGRGALALSFAGFVGIIVSYGFSLTAAREISVNRGDPEAISRTVSEVLCVEFCLLALCLAAYKVVLVWIPRLRADSLVMWVAFVVVGLNSLSPDWLYQGLEELRFSARVGVILRLAYIPALFLFVRKPSDTLAWLALQAATSGLRGCWLWLHAWRRLGVRWVRPCFDGMIRQLRQGFAIFFAHLAVSLYTSGNVFILGMVTNVTVAGYYSAAEKLVKAAISVWGPLQAAVFPRASQLASQSREAALRFARKLLLIQAGAGAALSVSLFAASPWIVALLFGDGFRPSITILQILSVVPFLIAVGNVLGIQVMVPFRRDGAFAAILLAAGLLNVGLGVLLSQHWQGNGMASSVACSETLVTASMFWYLWRNHLVPSANPESKTVEA